MYSVKEIYYTLQGEGAQTGRAAVFCRFAGCNLWSGREEDRATAICQFCDTDFADTGGPGGGKFASAEELARAIESRWRDHSLPGPQVRGTPPQRRRPVVGDPETGDTQGEDANAGPSTRPLLRSGLAQDDRSLVTPLAKSASGFALNDNIGNGGDDRRFVVCTGGEPLLQLDSALIDALHALDFEIAVETNGTIDAPSEIDWVCVSPKAGAELRQRSGDELKLIYPQAGAEPAALEGLNFGHFFLQPMDGPDREANTKAAIRYCLEHPRWRLSLQTHKMLGIP